MNQCKMLLKEEKERDESGKKNKSVAPVKQLM